MKKERASEGHSHTGERIGIDKFRHDKQGSEQRRYESVDYESRML
jgi:hypothetical protein